MAKSVKLNSEQKTLKKIAELKVKGLNNQLIAKQTGLSLHLVTQNLRLFEELLGIAKNIEVYRENKQVLIESAEAMALNSLAKLIPDNPDISKATRAFDVLHKATRLESGKSTDNRAIALTGTLDLGKYRK